MVEQNMNMDGLTNEQQTQNAQAELKEYEQIVDNQMKMTGNVSINDFVLLQVIGKGSYGKVYLVKKKDTQIHYALKVLKKEEIIRKKQYEHTMAERRILQSVDFPFIVKMDYAFQTAQKLHFCLEYCPGGELFFYLSQIGRFKEDAARFYAANILLALEHLHSKDILYRDLKPENVLVSGDGYIKLTDFGLSKDNIKGQQDAKSLCGTAEYLSPEILQRQGHGKATDWWSFGAIIYEMLIGLPPFYSKDRQKLYENIKYGEPKFDFAFLGADAKDLCNKLLQKDPSQRLGSGESDAQEIRAHPWFACLNWDEIKNKSISPPYCPQLDQAADTKHFPPEFTNMQLSPSDKEQLLATSANAFPGFSFNKESNDPAAALGANSGVEEKVDDYEMSGNMEDF